MTTPFRTALCALALLWPAGLALLAADPPGPPAKGRVLLLENERVLEGDIDQVGSQYRLRRSVGETWIPADQVLSLCADLREAYWVLRKRANLRDPDERLRLARWCQLHGLRAQALEEVQVAVALRPDHAESQRLLRNLQQWAASASQPPPLDRPETARPLPANIDLSAQTLGLFTSRVQPILMNTCASCHASGKGGNFKLTRAFADPLTNHRATQQNLAAVLAQLNRERPLSSPLLTRAVSVHGEAEQAPLKGRQTPAYRTLEDWVQQALADSEPAAPPSPLAALPAPEAKAPPVEAPARTEQAAPFAQARAPEQPAPAAGQPVAPADPFDPLIFNRQAHPQEK